MNFSRTIDLNEKGKEIKEEVVSLRRVAKVLKGGRRFSFSAGVVAGDGKGSVGWGSEKAREVPDAIKKSSDKARRSMIKVSLREMRTVHHDINVQVGAVKISIRSAVPGTGIVAGGAIRKVVEVMGIQDINIKIHGSSNPHNSVRALFKAFSMIQSPKQVANKRGKTVSQIFGIQDQSAQ